MTPGVRAIRTSVALTDLTHIALVRLQGPDAIEVLDRLVPRHLYLRDGEVLQTVFLRPDGTVLADVLVIADEEDAYLLLVEGLDADGVTAHLRAHTLDGEDAVAEPLGAEAALLGVDGPYAWELLVATIGPEVAGLPYLHAVALEGQSLLVRAGKTGEFGYIVICPVDEADGWRARLGRHGAAFDLGGATVDDLDVCGLENFFFSPRLPGIADLGLPELQLQWRVSPAKERYVGADAVRAAMSGPPARRLCYALADRAPEVGAEVRDGGVSVGRVLGRRDGGTIPGVIVWMLLDRDAAHPHHALDAAGVPVRTVAPPVVNNRSLYVDPQRHTYATRAETPFPELS